MLYGIQLIAIIFYFDFAKCKCPVDPGAPPVGGGGGGGGAAGAYETGAWGAKVEIDCDCCEFA